MRFLILSDIHSISADLESYSAYGSRRVSYCDIESKEVAKNPLMGIAPTLRDFRGQIDSILCLGDLAHHAKKLPLQETWRILHQVAEDLETGPVLGVTGNHDIASRPEDFEDLEKIGYIRNIHPPFPSSDTNFNAKYYLDGVATLDKGAVTIIAVDTCRLHGYGGAAKSDVFSVGNVTDEMISKIVHYTCATSSRSAVIMMHHHPAPVDEVLDTDNDVMKRGSELIERLKGIDKPVFILHGHKHMVKLKTIAGLHNPITLLSAASLSSLPHTVEHKLSANQFHILEVNDVAGSYGERGRLLSWEWRVNAWKPSLQAYMSHEVTIGRKPDLSDILLKLKSIPLIGFLSRADLLQQVPDLIFANVEEVEELNRHLAPLGRSIHQTSGQLKGLYYEESR
jgi:3',5'-cyclic AMP phosphodiesterase CpdA